MKIYLLLSLKFKNQKIELLKKKVIMFNYTEKKSSLLILLNKQLNSINNNLLNI